MMHLKPSESGMRGPRRARGTRPLSPRLNLLGLLLILVVAATNVASAVLLRSPPDDPARDCRFRGGRPDLPVLRLDDAAAVVTVTGTLDPPRPVCGEAGSASDMHAVSESVGGPRGGGP